LCDPEVATVNSSWELTVGSTSKEKPTVTKAVTVATPLFEQPFQILRLLLEHPGEVVTREEIRKKLWPNDTIVEFEHSISAAMNRLRQALGDSAENPRFIGTLAGRGYRLMVPVEWVERPPANPPVAVTPVALAGADPGSVVFAISRRKGELSRLQVRRLTGIADCLTQPWRHALPAKLPPDGEKEQGNQG
jgi:DNA-binding winged helix-turn-helix (wHTH) protein